MLKDISLQYHVTCCKKLYKTGFVIRDMNVHHEVRREDDEFQSDKEHQHGQADKSIGTSCKQQESLGRTSGASGKNCR